MGFTASATLLTSPRNNKNPWEFKSLRSSAGSPFVKWPFARHFVSDCLESDKHISRKMVLILNALASGVNKLQDPIVRDFVVGFIYVFHKSATMMDDFQKHKISWGFLYILATFSSSYLDPEIVSCLFDGRFFSAQKKHGAFLRQTLRLTAINTVFLDGVHRQSHNTRLPKRHSDG